jgi:hypothetical protein
MRRLSIDWMRAVAVLSALCGVLAMRIVLVYLIEPMQARRQAPGRKVALA